VCNRSYLLLGLSIVLVALNLRTSFTSLPVLLPDIISDLHLSHLHSGNLTTLPTLCLGLFAPLAPWLARRFNMEKIILVLLIILAAGLALRAMGLVSLLYMGAIMAGGTIAIVNVFLPALVKRDFVHHMSLMTAFYTMGICGGAAIAAAFSVPLQQNFLGGSWQLSLGFWAVPVLIVAYIWHAFVPKNVQREESRDRPMVRGLWRDRLAWQVTLLMGFQSALAYIGFGWMAPILHERGLTMHMAAAITSLSILTQILGCLIVPILMGRHIRQSALNAGLSLMATIGFCGLFFAPFGPIIWLFAALQGFGQGAMLAAAMMMIVLRSRDVHVAAQLSAMAQCVGYCIAALGPFAVGVLRESGGDLNTTMLVVLVVGTLMAFFGFLAGRPLFCKATLVNTNKGMA